MLTTLSSSIAQREKGSALIEGLIAILIFSLGILGVVGLQATTTKTVSEAKNRVDASFVASQRVARIWTDMTNLSTYAEPGTDITDITDLPKGKRTTAINGNEVTVTITWKQPGDSTVHSYKTIARIVGN